MNRRMAEASNKRSFNYQLEDTNNAIEKDQKLISVNLSEVVYEPCRQYVFK